MSVPKCKRKQLLVPKRPKITQASLNSLFSVKLRNVKCSHQRTQRGAHCGHVCACVCTCAPTGTCTSAHTVHGRTCAIVRTDAKTSLPSSDNALSLPGSGAVSGAG